MSPGFEEGQEACIHKRLTDYAKELNIPYFGLQLWRGSGEDSYVEGYALVDKNTNQVMFMDSRIDVCEYMLEMMSKRTQENEAIISS